MELLTVVDDFFVTASLALLLTFIILKLVDAMNDTHTTPKRHVVHEPVPVSHAKPLTVHPALSKSKIRVMSPVQPATCIEDASIQPVHSVPTVQVSPVLTAGKIEEATVEPVSPVPTVDLISHVQVATCVETVCRIEDVTVQPVHSVPMVQLSPVRAATCEGIEHKLEATVEPVNPVPTFNLISPVQAATCAKNESKIEEETMVEPVQPEQSNITCIETEKESDSAEKRNVEGVKEISVEYSSGIEISVADSSVKENDYDDDDWEGIERSELEKEFMAATEFVSGEDKRLGSVGSSVQMELYGLHKVATEGPCREPQPMPLKISARAKWNAWQKLGNMNPEDAMEQYISLLSDKFPGWMKDTSAGMSEDKPTWPGVSDSAPSDLSLTLSDQQMIMTEREVEQESDSEDRGLLTESDLENNVKK